MIAQGLWHPNYSHIREPIGALAMGPYGWIQRLNFTVAGLLWVTFALGLHFGLRPVPRATTGSLFLRK